MKTRTVLFLSLVALGLGAGYLVLRGSYPVIFVNGTPISRRVFEEKHFAALTYYQSALATYAGSPSEFGIAERRELRRAVLEGLVEEALIHEELLGREPAKLALTVENKIAKALENPDFSNAARTLYGLDLERAKRYLLVPQAEREILEGRLFLENQELDAWLAAAKRAARVTLLVPGYSWNNGGVVAE